jgi:DNA repair protein RadD
MMCEIIKALTSRDWYAVLYTNRRMLIDQLVGVLHRNGIACGVRAAGYESNKSLPVQISSLQTERARQWEPHGEGRKCLVVVDEAHLNAGWAVQEILEWHESRKHVRLGVTATPLDIGHLYDHLIVAGTNSELRDCGALVTAIHYGPDEPDTLALKKVTLGKDLSEKQQRKAIMTPTIWGRVIDGYRKLNPTNRPTILFAPGVGESIGFAEQFQAAGIPAAHIDGENVWRNGKLYRRVRGEKDAAADILAASKAGEVMVICNRFVLREGIDAPWLSVSVRPSPSWLFWDENWVNSGRDGFRGTVRETRPRTDLTP